MRTNRYSCSFFFFRFHLCPVPRFRLPHSHPPLHLFIPASFSSLGHLVPRPHLHLSHHFIFSIILTIVHFPVLIVLFFLPFHPRPYSFFSPSSSSSPVVLYSALIVVFSPFLPPFSSPPRHPVPLPTFSTFSSTSNSLLIPLLLFPHFFLLTVVHFSVLIFFLLYLLHLHIPVIQLLLLPRPPRPFHQP